MFSGLKEELERSEYDVEDDLEESDLDDADHDIILNFLLHDLQFEDHSNGILLFQLTASYTPIPLTNMNNCSSIYHYKLPIPSYSGVLCVINDSKLRRILLNPSNLVNQYLSIFFFDISMKLTGRCSIQLDEYSFQSDDLGDIHALWSYEFDSIINHAIGVGTKNGNIKGLMMLSKLPRCKNKVPQIVSDHKEVVVEEVGEGSLGEAEFLPESEFVEELQILPKSCPEPFDRREKPLRHFMTVDDDRGQIQTEYRPGYVRTSRQQSPPPSRLSVERPRWSASQSVRSVDRHRDHLLRCVACWLRSVQCENCQDDQQKLQQLKMDGPIPPPPRQGSPPLPPPQLSTNARKEGQKKKPKQPSSRVSSQKQRSKSQPRTRQMPNTNPSPSVSRLRQHTFSSAIATQTPSTGNTSKLTRGFHFINPQPDVSPRQEKPKQTQLQRQLRPTSNSGSKPSSQSLPQANLDREEYAMISPAPSDPLQDDYYPKISSPVQTPPSERDNREQNIFITPHTHLGSNDFCKEEDRACSSTLDWRYHDEILYYAP